MNMTYRVEFKVGNHWFSHPDEITSLIKQYRMWALAHLIDKREARVVDHHDPKTVYHYWKNLDDFLSWQGDAI